MMIKKATVLLIYLFILNIVSAQNMIKGTVSDNEGNPIFFATVILYNVQNNQIVKAETSDENGDYIINGIANGSYNLSVRMLGFETFENMPISFPEKNNEVIDLEMKPDAEVLDVVEVVGKTPLMEQKADRLVVNVESSALASTGSLADAMKSVPGIIVTGRGVTMAGQSGVTILIDGKTTQYMDIQSLLQNIPAENIKQIEVIHQPGAEFDAQGTGPILNIILKSKKALGTSGSLSARVQKDYRWLYGGGFFLNHYQNDLNINGYISYTTNANQEILDVTRNIENDIYKQKSINPNDLSALATNLSVDWDITEKQKIGVASQFNIFDNDQLSTSETSIDYEDVSLTNLNLTTDNTQDGKSDYLSVNPYYIIEFDTSLHKLDVDFNYFSLVSESFNDLNTINVDNTNSFFPGQRFDQPGDTKIFAVKADYAKPLNNKFSLNFGVKYSRADLENDLNVFNEVMENEWMRSETQSNLYKFEETISAAYAKLNMNVGEWSGTLGLRFEDSKSIGKSITTNTTLQRDISKLFPSFSIQRVIADPIALSLVYSYRIDRPSYLNLNPFTTSLDPFTGFRGNTTLIPALTHSAKMNVIYDGYPFLSAEYKYINDPMVEVTEQNDDTGETFLRTVNLDVQKIFNVQFITPIDFFIESIEGFVGVNVNYNEYETEYLNQALNRNKWTYNIFIRTEFSLPGKIDAEIGGSYVSGILDGIMEIDNFYTVDVGLSKKLFDRKLRIALTANDVVYRFRDGDINFDNMDIEFRDDWYTPKTTLSLAYRFGNEFLKQKKARKAGAKEEIGRTTKPKN